MVAASAPAMMTTLGSAARAASAPALSKVDIGFGIDGIVTPFGIDVWLIPKLVIVDTPLIAADHGADEIGVILYIVGRGKAAHRLPAGRGSRQAAC